MSFSSFVYLLIPHRYPCDLVFCFILHFYHIRRHFTMHIYKISLWRKYDVMNVFLREKSADQVHLYQTTHLTVIPLPQAVLLSSVLSLGTISTICSPHENTDGKLTIIPLLQRDLQLNSI